MEAVKSYVMDMTPELAGEWLEKYAYENQRKLDSRIVKMYADYMRRGLWREGSNDLKLATLEYRGNGDKALVDGQHRLAALRESGTSMRFVVTEVPGQSDESVAGLYSVIDRGKGRRILDGFVASRLADVVGVSTSELTRASGAINLIRSNFMRHMPPSRLQDDINAAILEYADAIRLFYDAVYHTKPFLYGRLRRAPVMAVGLATLRYAIESYGEDYTSDFWRGIAENDGLRKGDPRKVAVDHISETALGDSSAGNKGVSAQYQSRFVAACWNAWAERRSLAYTKVSDAGQPIKILGTPWKGG